MAKAKKEKKEKKEKHKGYETLKLLISGNSLTEFSQIFVHMSETAIRNDLGINNARFKRMLTKVQEFKLEELYTLSNLIGVDEKSLLDLAHSQYMANKKTTPAVKSKKESQGDKK